MAARSRGFSGALVMAFLLAGQAALGQTQPTTAELKKDIEALQTALKAIQKDIQEIKALLQDRQPAAALQNVAFDMAGRPFKGAKTARLMLVEFSDYECPYCARYLQETSPQIQKEYIDTGKVKWVFVDFPIESLHKRAFRAAEAARCAGEQGKYWEMHDRLFANQQALDAWTAHAEAVGLDLTKFQSCLEGGKYASEIRKDLKLGQSLGVTGTPAFVLLLTDSSGASVKTARVLRGAQPFAVFKIQIDALLAEQGPETREKL